MHCTGDCGQGRGACPNVDLCSDDDDLAPFGVIEGALWAIGLTALAAIAGFALFIIFAS